MIINNSNLAEVVNMLVCVVIGVIVIMGFLLFVIKLLFDYVRDVEVKLIAQTSPEHKALTRAYFNTLYEEHKKNREYDKRLDKMFEEERSE